jgi:hypothetical protein
MNENRDLAFHYDIAQGPAGLKNILDTYLVSLQNDSHFAEATHYILYQMGDQQALIRVDMSTSPFHFKYCDLFGRPATKSVKETIAKFLWDNCGEKERYLKELEARERL